MDFLFVGIFVGTVAYVINRVFAKLGAAGIFLLAPVSEELLKSGGAVIAGADIFLVHIVFGIIEAVFDIVMEPRNGPAPIVGLAGHVIFGYISALAFTIGGLIWALIAASGVHIIWNYSILYIVGLKK